MKVINQGKGMWRILAYVLTTIHAALLVFGSDILNEHTSVVKQVSDLQTFERIHTEQHRLMGLQVPQAPAMQPQQYQPMSGHRHD